MNNIKFNCPQCGTHLAVDVTGAGMTVACPNCGQTILVPERARLAKKGSLERGKWWMRSLIVDTAVVVALIAATAQATEEFMAGGLVIDYIARKTWGTYWKTTDPFQVMKENGFGWCETGVLTTSSLDLANLPPDQWHKLPWKDEYWGCLEYTTEVLRKARDAGLHLHVLLAMSDEATHPGKQNIPPSWQKLSDADLAVSLEQSCRRTAAHFAAKGLNVELYTMGNEIEFGILKTTRNNTSWAPPGVDVFNDLEFLQTKVWPREAFLLKAAIRGVKSANPRAGIALHPNSVGRSAGNRHLRAFLSFMVSHGVEFDYVSFSDPQPNDILVEGTRPYYRSAQFKSLVDYVARLGKKVLIGEFFYPQDSVRITGQPDPGYPFSPEGQARWIRDFLGSVSTNKAIAGVFYWDPDYFPGYGVNSEDSKGLFKDDSHAQPAMAEFRRFLQQPKPGP